ncbi:MAG: transcription-repair coupling factor, partial [Polyangiaceae bacterium]
MPSSPSLTSTLEERAGLTAQELSRPAAAEELEPLPSLLPPEGVTAARVRDVTARVRGMASGRVDVAGVRGSAGAVLAAAIARLPRRVVLITSDLDSARRAAEDVGFLARGSLDDAAEDTGEGEVLVFAACEASPYADVNPDRRAAMSRVATLFHLAHQRPWSVLVAPASALVRKVVPRKELARRADRVVTEQEIDRDGLVLSLAEAGYLRVPVVEDPGSFAVRGALLDVWPPSSDAPVRVELYGDLVLSMKSFDPVDQTTRKDAPELSQLWLSPVHEAILDRRNLARARERITQLAEAMDWPTTKTRALVDDVLHGRAFFGAEGYLPAYYEELDPLLAYVPADAVVVLDDPPAITRAVREELERATADATQKEGSAPTFLPEAFYRDEAAVATDLASRTVVPLHRTAVAG